MWSSAASVFPLLDVAMISASPGSSPLASPLELTLAFAFELLHVTVAPMMGCPAASYATAENCWVEPCSTVADAGETSTRATSAGGGGGVWLSLQVPKSLALGPSQRLAPEPRRLMDRPAASVPASLTGICVAVIPSAGPLSAANVPSYDRNSIT